jgi:hypothetical protein
VLLSSSFPSSQEEEKERERERERDGRVALGFEKRERESLEGEKACKKVASRNFNYKRLQRRK